MNSRTAVNTFFQAVWLFGSPVAERVILILVVGRGLTGCWDSRPNLNLNLDVDVVVDWSVVVSIFKEVVLVIQEHFEACVACYLPHMSKECQTSEVNINYTSVEWKHWALEIERWALVTMTSCYLPRRGRRVVMITNVLISCNFVLEVNVVWCRWASQSAVSSLENYVDLNSFSCRILATVTTLDQIP